jgi:hypothetical protein
MNMLQTICEAPSRRLGQWHEHVALSASDSKPRTLRSVSIVTAHFAESTDEQRLNEKAGTNKDLSNGFRASVQLDEEKLLGSIVAESEWESAASASLDAD